MSEDRDAIQLRRRMLIRASLATAAAATVGCPAPSPCLRIAMPPLTCSLPEGTTTIGDWIFVGGESPAFVPARPLLLAGDMLEEVAPLQSGAEAVGAARIRVRWVTGAPNRTLSEGASTLLEALAKLVAGYRYATLELRIQRDDPVVTATTPAEDPEKFPVASARARLVASFLAEKGGHAREEASGWAPTGSFFQTIVVRVCAPTDGGPMKPPTPDARH